MKVGASQINITPELPFLLAGSAAHRVAKTVLDPLMASCIVVESNETRLALISCDILNIKDEVAEIIRRKICEKTGIKVSNIILSATHTHQGPKTGVNIPVPWVTPNDEMIRTLIDKIVGSAVEADRNKRKAKIGYNKGNVDKCTFNRRYIMSNGKSKYAFRGDNPERLVPEGPVDSEVQIVWFEDAYDNYIGVAVNFSSHPTVLFNTEFVSSDFPGAVRNVVQTIIGKNVPVLYLQGACGNLNTVDIEDERTRCEGSEGLKRIGRLLGGEVLKLISQDNTYNKDNIEIDILNRNLDIPLREITREEEETAIKRWKQFSDEEKCDINKFKEVYHIFSTIELARQRKINPNASFEISVVRLDDIYIVTNPAELFVEYQIEMKNNFKGKKIMVVELTNGHAGYVPTKLAFALGGYEAERAISSKLDRDAGRIIVENSIELIKKIMK